MGNGASPHGPSYRAHPRLYHRDESDSRLACLKSGDNRTLARSAIDANDPTVWSGRAVQEVSSIRLMRSCITVSGLSLERLLRAIMDISAHATSFSTSLERASWVTSVRTRREDRSLHRRFILSQTSAGNSREARSSIISLLHAVPLFVSGGRSFVPACGCTGAPRARSVKAGRRDDVAACASVSRPRLDGPEHGARIKQIGTLLHWSWRTRRHAPYGEPPRRSGRVC